MSDDIRIQSILEDLDRLEEAVSETSTDVKEIRTALLGDQFGNEGYVHRLKQVERDTKENTQKLNKIWYYAVGAGTVMSIVFTIVMKLLDFV